MLYVESLAGVKPLLNVDCSAAAAPMQADYAEVESCISSIAFAEKPLESNGDGEASGGMLLATGGEDGMLRVWELRADRSE